MGADFKQGTNLAGGTLACLQIATATETPVYTVPPLSAAKVASASLHNDSALTLASVAIYKTHNIGGTPGTKRRIALITNLAAGDSTNLTELIGSFLEAGCVISATPSAVTAATFDITGAVSS